MPSVVTEQIASETKIETKSDKFKRLAEKRVNACLTKIRLIGNLASGQYKSDAEAIEKIEQTLYNAVETTMAEFRKTAETRTVFSL